MAAKEEVTKAPVSAAAPFVQDEAPLGHEVAQLPVEPGEGPAGNFDDDAPRSKYAEFYYLHLRDPFEQAAARQWLKKQNAKHAAAGLDPIPDENLVDSLPLDRLRQHSRIFILARKGTSREPIREAQPVTDRNDQGHLIHKSVPADDLSSDMKAYGDIRLAQFWTPGRSRLAPDLRLGDLQQEIAKYAIPSVVMREESADEKTNRKPTNIYLRHC